MTEASTGGVARRVSWWRHAVAAGGALETARVVRRFAPGRDAVELQERTRRELTRNFSSTAFGRSQGVEPEMSYARFRARVALRRYEEFAPWIERMKRGEADVLWPGHCAYYAVSSGTTAGRTKFLPINREMIAHFRRTGLDSLCLYARRAGTPSVFRGRHLFLGGSTALARLPAENGFQAWTGDLSGITAVHLPRWAERCLYEPGREIAQLEDWPAKLRAIAERTRRRDLTLLAGIPSWILVFAAEVRGQTGCADLEALWPRLECFVHGGVPVTPFVEPLREALGRGVRFHEVYPASEAFIAAQDDEPEAGLRLLADANVFYEFLPMAEFDEERIGALGEKTVPLEGVRAGVDYALVMSTPGGLCRYVIGDVVRFVSVQPPRLVYAGRTRLQLSAFGEHVIEKEVTDAIAEVCSGEAMRLTNFHVAPVFADPARGVARGRHEWWIEARTAGGALPDAAALAARLDAALQRFNDDYEAKRRGGGLEAPSVRLVPAGVFERWLRRRGKWGGQNKMPRCRSDREIADELAALLD